MSEEPQVQLTRSEAFRRANAQGLSWLLIIFVLLMLAAAVLIFGKNQQIAGGPVSTVTESPTPSSSMRLYTISYDAGVFSPTNLRIHAGDTVRFKNSSIFPIRITSQDLAGFDSVGDIPQGSYFSFTFSEPGTYAYYNEHNPDQTGSIIVRQQ